MENGHKNITKKFDDIERRPSSRSAYRSNHINIAIDTRPETNANSDDEAALYKDNEHLKIPLGPVKKIESKSAHKTHWFFRNVTRTLLALLLFLLSVNLDMYVLAVIHDRVPNTSPLPDIVFDLTKKVDWALDVSECIIIVITILMLIMITLHRYTWIVLRRLLVILSILYFLRGICMAVTQVPVANPQYYCSPKTNFSQSFKSWTYVKTIINRVSYMSLGLGLSINGRHTFCGDYIFSGHTTILVLCYLILKRYLFSTKNNLFWRLMHALCLILILAGVTCILIARGHYTIDIVIAFIMTFYTFYIYHVITDTIEHKPIEPNCRKSWWYRVFAYFEHDIIEYNVVVENRFRLPPSLFCFCRRVKRRVKLIQT